MRSRTPLVLSCLAILTIVACSHDAVPPVTPNAADNADTVRLVDRPHASSSAFAGVTVNAKKPGATISSELLGARAPQIGGPYGAPPWSNLIVAAAKAIPIGFSAYGDSGTWPPALSGVSDSGGTDFDDWIKYVATPAGSHAAVYVPIGSNPHASARTAPSDAAAYVAYANDTMHYGVKYWAIGFDPGAGDSADLGPPPYFYQDFGLYVSTAQQFKTAMKAQDPAIAVGAWLYMNVQPQASVDAANIESLARTVQPDFILWDQPEMTIRGNSSPTDHELLYEAIPNLHRVVTGVKAALIAAGQPNVLMLPVIDSSGNGQAGSQQGNSITAALYTGMVLGELAQAGAGSEFTEMVGQCESPFSIVPGVYGWTQWDVLSPIAPPAGVKCAPMASVPDGTILPQGRAMQVARVFAVAGQHALPVAVDFEPYVRAYAATLPTGYAVLLFNLTQAQSQTVDVKVAGAGKVSSFTATATYYDKAIYDLVRENQFVGPATKKLGTVKNPFTVSLPPWSMTVITLDPRHK